MQDGVRALALNLYNYWANYGLDTVTQIITRWAPPNENDTAAYIADVANQLGVDPNAALAMNDPATIQNLVAAITSHENGFNPLTTAQITQGVAAALPA